MTGWVDVVTPAEYTAFLAARTAGSEPLGKEIFEGVCATCHGLAGQGDYGPKIKGNALVADPKALERRSSATARTRCPPVGATWNDDDDEGRDRPTSKEQFGGS